MNGFRRDEACRLAQRAHVAAVRPGAARVLLLDLDGTLAPIASSPALVRVGEPVRQAIRTLRAGGWRVAVVSGRRREEAARLVGIPGMPVFGSHGLEGPAASDVATVDPLVAGRLVALESAMRNLAADAPAILFERKVGSLALGDRALPPGARTRWRRRLRSALRNQDLAGLDLLYGRCVLEVRDARATKARALSVLAPVPLRWVPDESLIAIGDDRTDEDLFAALAESGLGVLVGRPRRTRARARISSPAAVGRFLQKLAVLSTSREEAP
ncbi:MAG: trehalose-phosphatase [Acidobacteria bacterium]|nr:trehalose-phosphatase [Acidobacteriota bacterium]MCU0253844.1 trehalose-phosphatase [Acidobacteriota bacterium]